MLKTVLGDRRSPVLYGYDQNALAVYFNQGPILSVGGGGGFGRGGGGGGGGATAVRGNFGNMQPNAVPHQADDARGRRRIVAPVTPADPAAAVDAAGGRGRGGAAAAVAAASAERGGGGANPNAPRVLLSFPTDPNDLLLSGLLVGGEAIAGRAVAIDAPIGKGHVVMFANRPYWRWQTQGNFFLGFNTILNWNDLDAGRAAPATTTAQQR